MFRLKEISKDGKTTYVVQQRIFWFFWWDMTDPMEDKTFAEGVKIILNYKCTGQL